MKTNKINLTLTEKEFEIIRRAIVKYAADQMDKSTTFGNPDADSEDGYAIRALIATDIQCKLHKKTDARPELNHISIF